VKDLKDEATRRLLEETFRELAGKAGSGVGRILTQEEIRLRGGDPNAFLAVEAASGFAFADGHTGDLVYESLQKGTHGYLPVRDDMKTSLLIYGPAVSPGKIDGARLIDVAPTAAQFLGLTLREAEGKALPVSIRKAAAR
jgi:hypothetical protein